jgi:hypothetical protein
MKGVNMRAISLKLVGRSQLICDKDDDIIESLRDLLKDCSDGDEIQIRILEMPQEEFDNLLEFDGF